MKRLIVQIGMVLALWIGAETSIPVIYKMVSVPSNPDVALESMLGVIRSDHEYSVLFFGDSTVTNGVVPAEFDARTEEDSYVFGTASGAAGPEDALLMEEYLTRHQAPKAVFLVRSPAMWQKPIVTQILREAPRNMRLTFFLYRNGFLPLEDYLEITLSSLLPSAHYRYRFSRFIASLIDPQVWETFEKDYASSVRVSAMRLQTKGFDHVTGILGAIAEENWKSLRTLMKDGGADIRPENIALLQYMCDLAEEHSTQMFVTFAPFAKALADDPGLRSAFDDIEATLSSVTADHPSCTYLPAESPYDNTALIDETHTNASGAIIFTRHLAAVFNEAGSVLENQIPKASSRAALHQ